MAPLVAITGFANISGNPEDEWLGTGIAETLAMDAAQIQSVSVVPRERVSDTLRMLRRQTGEPEERLYVRAARALGARWAVSGAFQRSRDAVRVTASLTEVATGDLVSTARVDGRIDAIFELQDRLVRELAASLRAAISPAAAAPEMAISQAAAPETEVVGAYEAFSRGLLNRQAESYEALDRAVMLFTRAVTLDPSYSRAHVELGSAMAAKADDLSMPELYPVALASLRRAVELHSESARAWRELGAALTSTGQEAEATAAVRRALALDPADAAAYASMARINFILRARFADAAEWFERAIEKNPSAGWYPVSYTHLTLPTKRIV